jgi:quinol monooxygenase YgiN
MEPTMATLDPKDGYAVLINTFYVAPDRAEELLALLTAATQETMRFRPGFISANLHLSLDRTRVVNYAQWRSRADFEAILQHPEARVHMKEAANIAASFDPVLCELRYSDNAGPA